MRVFGSPRAIDAATGDHLGHSDWLCIDADRITAFADATGDRQWIHVDAERARRGPFGAPIAHGYLLLALLPVLSRQVYRVDGAGLAVNYGLDRVRFPTPVRAGADIRAGVRVLAVADVPGGVQVRSEVTVELRDSPEPCCVAETLTRWYEVGP
ncbi:MAG TPA: MaoC family dehydratase [Micromonosporaceae bacterium]|nr:MaoC family dehydratase [Micromonosporaceae bacterium]